MGHIPTPHHHQQHRRTASNPFAAALAGDGDVDAGQCDLFATPQAKQHTGSAPDGHTAAGSAVYLPAAPQVAVQLPAVQLAVLDKRRYPLKET